MVLGQEIDYWIVPALGFSVLADNDALGGGGFTRAFGGDEATLDKEEYSRDVQEVLRGDANAYRLWGVAIDANLTSAEQGASAGPFITFTIIAVLVVVGFVLRSYWSVALVGGSLAILMVWLKGITNLLGFESSLIMDFIVPIAMISFGVDFAFHAVGRYREEAARGGARSRAFVTGLTAVSAALLLAFLSDSVAFASNVTSGIPAVIQFGLGAAIALAAADLILGVVTPLTLMRIEERLPRRASRRSGSAQALQWSASALAATAAGFSVLFLIFFPVIGVIALPLYFLVFLALPLWLKVRRAAAPAPATALAPAGGSWPLAGRAATAVARGRALVLPLAIGVTALAVWSASTLEASFDVKDFFTSDSDFVVSLDKLDEHSAAGEGAIVYVEGDLSTPAALIAIQSFVDGVAASQSGRFGRLASGELQIEGGALEIVNEAMASPAAVSVISTATGVALSDDDGDGIADSREAIAAIYGFAARGGIPGDEGLVLTPDDIPARLWTAEDGSRQATQILIGLTGTREQANVRDARDELEPLLAELEQALQAADPSATVQLSGSPIERDEGLRATVRALVISLPVAVVLCLVVAALFMRSLRYAAVATIPILLVVAWLYGLMAVLGYDLNVVTATIGAISIGVGIDFAIHFTMRYREELAALGVRLTAMEATGAGTGTALIASACSSIIGFAIMAFAPMPMFAAYGLLTAIMIAFAATASLVVLPGLLMLVTADRLPDTATAPAAGVRALS